MIKELEYVALFLLSSIDAINDALEFIPEERLCLLSPAEKVLLILGHSPQPGDDDAHLLTLGILLTLGMCTG